jgi:hypothetical protein
MKNVKQKTPLDQTATYQIKVSGHLPKRWSDWVEGMTMRVKSKGNDPPSTILIITVDQAALVGLLRRLYGLGLPLISVRCVEDER